MRTNINADFAYTIVSIIKSIFHGKKTVVNLLWGQFMVLACGYT